MDRFDVIRFDDLTGPKGGEWIRIGGGSFGVVFRGEYLGTEVAIKEVLPNNTYDVEKYFERECVLMKEARHPNIVQYIGLTKSTGADGRIYIVSEFVGPNLRQCIADKRKAFDWPLRISFSTDIARAVAYLHARNCMHRDLKGENLLITDNNRIKVCDFGFARIAARNDEEMRRISYCGTDGYMSPEILMGVDFSLPSDVFSLGVIFCEIISRHLVDSSTFKRELPSFGLDEDEVREMASDGCPTDFIQLCLDMTRVEPSERPDMRHVIRRLRAIEQVIVQREHAKGTLTNVGSLRGASLAAVMGTKTVTKSKHARRLPSFGGQVSTSRVHETAIVDPIKEERHVRNASESSDEDVEEALRALEELTAEHKDPSSTVAASIRAAKTFKAAGHGDPWWDDTTSSSPGLPASWLQYSADRDNKSSTLKRVGKKSEPTADQEIYSTSVVRPSRQIVHPSLASSVSKMTGTTMKNGADNQEHGSVMTMRRQPLSAVLGSQAISRRAEVSEAGTLKPSVQLASTHAQEQDGSHDDSTASFMTARSGHPHHRHHQHGGDPSLAMATVASSSIYEHPHETPLAVYHRFTLVKNGTRRVGDDSSSAQAVAPTSKMTYQLILANALTKCNVCTKRLGFGAYMDCDDCPYKTHVGCADAAEPNCLEMHIPGSPAAPGTPMLNGADGGAWQTASPRPYESPAAKGRQEEHSASGTPPQRAAQARRDSAKSPPSSLSKGVAFLRKRNSKSPPPQPASSPRQPSLVQA